MEQQGATGNHGQIRSSNRVPVSDRAVHTKKTRCSKGSFLAGTAWAGGAVLRGREVQSGVGDLPSGRGPCSRPILDEVSGFDPLHDAASTPDSAGPCGRGRWDGWRMGEESEKGAGGEIGTPRYLAGTGMKARTPVAGARTGTTPSQTRTTTSGCAASVTTVIGMRSIAATAHWADPIKCGQPVCPASANTNSGPSLRGVVKHRNAQTA